MKNVNVQRYVAAFIWALWAMAPFAAEAANCCSVNGGTCNIQTPLTHGQNGWMGTVCGTTLSGVNCVAKLDASVGSSSGSDCVTLGSGVTFDLNGYTMTCTGSPCGIAIKNTSSGNTSNAVVIKNGAITGPWTTGVAVTGGTNSSVTDLTVTGAGTGISGVKGSIEYARVYDSTTTGIVLAAGKDLAKSLIEGNPTGLSMPDANYTGTDIDDVFFVNNGYSINDQGSGADMQRSCMQMASTCHCYANVGGTTACHDIDDCVTITNSGVPTFVDDDRYP